MCEKANHTIITRVKLALDANPKKKWSTHLAEVTQQYNDTPHDATGFPPRYLQFGVVNSPEFATIIPLETARATAKIKSDSFKYNRKQAFDLKHKPSNFNVGDSVLRLIADNNPSKTKISPANDGSFIIIALLGPETYRIQRQDDPTNITTSHSSQLIKFQQRTETLTVGE